MVGGRDLIVGEAMLRLLMTVRDPSCVKLRVLEGVEGRSVVAAVEGAYPMYAWNEIWTRLKQLRVKPGVREVMFRFLHGILPSGVVLFNRRIREGGECRACGSMETILHAVYFCDCIEVVRVWLGKVFRLVGGGGLQVLRALSLDIGGVSKMVENAVAYLVTDFIYTSWAMREVGVDERIKVLAATFYRTKCRNREIYGGSWETAFTEGYRSFRLRDLWDLRAM